MTRIFNAAITHRIEAAGIRGLERAAARILAASQEAVPVDTGATRASAYVTRVDDRTVEIGYSDPKAAALHENLTATHAAGKTAKFLERAIVADPASVAEDVAREIRVETR